MIPNYTPCNNLLPKQRGIVKGVMVYTNIQNRNARCFQEKKKKRKGKNVKKILYIKQKTWNFQGLVLFK